ncbi:MAG: hypothetical protein AAGA37_21130 [Actinomycetota bacterium]
MRTSTVIAVAVALLISAACGTSTDDEPVAIDDSPAPTTTPAPTTSDAPTTTAVPTTAPAVERSTIAIEQTLLVDRVERRYHVGLPEDPVGAPVVIVLHQNSSSADATLGLDGVGSPHALWLELVDDLGIVVVGAVGVGGAWNDCRADADTNSDADDVAYLEAMVDELVEQHGVADDQVFLTGTSNGGHMAIRMAEERPDRIAGFAAIAAANAQSSECVSAGEAVPALFMNGTADSIMPFAGGAMFSGSLVESAEGSVADWAERFGLSEPTTNVLADVDPADGSTITTTSYASDGTVIATLYAVEGGGHNEPSRVIEAGGGFFGTQNRDIETVDVVWEFFSDLLA